MPGAVSPKNPKLEAVYDVLIDNTGQFKYILCKVYDSERADQSKFIIRGGHRYQFHSDIYDELDTQLEEYGLVCECLGGGQICHEASKKTIEVFGLSQGYGKANHHLTADILKTKFSDYVTLIWRD